MNTRTTLFAAVLLTLSSLPGLSSPAAAADTYQLDPTHASVFFRVKHLGVSYCYGRFNDLAGSLVLDEQNPANNSLQVQVKADTVDTNNAKRDQHLKGPDFFNVREFPVISFKSRQVKPVSPQAYEVTGDLTLHGVTRTITVQLQRVGSGRDPRGGYRTGFES